MFRSLLLLLLSVWILASNAQNPSSLFQLPSKTIVMPCGATCTTVTATVPDIRQSDDYQVQAIPFHPFNYEGGTELTALYADDIYSSVISLPFPACFYGATYNSLTVGSNGIVTFDITNAVRRNNFRLTTSFFNLTPVQIPYAGGTQNSLASTYYPRASIMGVYHDIFPFNNGSRRIEWRMEGTAPKRRFIASFKDVPMYSCTSQSATHQIVVYESTGIVEVYVEDKPVCTAWNEGLAILGVQNYARNKAAFPAGKNTSQWGSLNMQEAYRFVPSAGLSKFKRAELLSEGVVIALADTTSDGQGNLQLAFPNICPVKDSSAYVLRVSYQSCTSQATEVSFEDTVIIQKEDLQVSLQQQEPTCNEGGSIRVQASGTTSPLTYSLNGGMPQSSPLFENLPAGEYSITVNSNSGCVKTATATLTLQDDLLLVAQPVVTVCEGETITPQVLSNGSSFQWSPSTGISNANEAHPEIKAQRNQTYTLTASKGVCQQSADIVINVKPLPLVNAGADRTVIQGDETTLAASASGGTVNWTPATGLSAVNTVQPTAKPFETTTYRLTAIQNGCMASDEVTITVVPYCIKPMAAFSPNSDGINDRWLVTDGSCLQKAKVEIFNRYGAPVYRNDSYNNDWNGTYSGKPLPDGTYYYIITYQLINGKTVSTKGNVTILR
ncbi:MAG TPA: gliding motility-associated C-terminal domain-containing protein [Flavisolibacter sp.]|jgi:gliding motility-associated-like protein|nr:gliding motility-associated C-terminal domain-containing protein [Flavisolibacter sp.]